MNLHLYQLKSEKIIFSATAAGRRRLKLKNLNYGVNIKIIRRIIGDFSSSWGFGMDFGIQFKTKNNWSFGLMARDITTTYNSWSINQDRLDDIQNAIEGQNQEVPNGTEITIPKLQIGVFVRAILISIT